MTMTLEQHRLCGPLLAYARAGTYTGPMWSALSKLDSLVYVEYGRQSPPVDTCSIYYGNHPRLPAKPSASEYADAIAGVEQAKQLLALHYRPARVRPILAKLDRAIATMRRRRELVLARSTA
jgi:hypothetical protein